jgi:signal transduction histidine kinase
MSRTICTEAGGVTMRRMVWTALAILAVLLTSTAAALSVTTTLLDRNVAAVGAALEGARVAQAIDRELSAFHHASAAAGQGADALSEASRRRIQQLLAEARRHATETEGPGLAARAGDAVTAYLALAREAPGERSRAALEDGYAGALSAIDALTWHDVDEASRHTAAASRLDRLADETSVGVGALALIVCAALVLELRGQVYRPLARLSDVVNRFEAGDAEARVEERGVREVRRLARSFNAMADALTQHDRDRLSFLISIAQDLRDPLTVLKLATRAGGDASAAPLVERQVQQMESILRDIVDVALIAAGKLDLLREPVDLRGLVLEAVEAFRAASPGHLFEATVPDASLVARVDGKRVEHVLNNLLSNAAKLSPRGARVSVSLVDASPLAVLIVSDQGVGMSAADRALAFEPFRRGASRREGLPGVGLGLCATKRIVEAHGGTIEVESTPGAGSTFRVTLPIDATG